MRLRKILPLLYQHSQYRADDFNIDGTRKSSSQVRATFGHAASMRSALSYRFAMVPTRGRLPWSQNELGAWKGNPSLSSQVSHYMLSLRRRKVYAVSALHCSVDCSRELFIGTV